MKRILGWLARNYANIMLTLIVYALFVLVGQNGGNITREMVKTAPNPQKRAALLQRIPMIYAHGGNMDVEVTNTVDTEVTNTVEMVGQVVIVK